MMIHSQVCQGPRLRAWPPLCYKSLDTEEGRPPAPSPSGSSAYAADLVHQQHQATFSGQALLSHSIGRQGLRAYCLPWLSSWLSQQDTSEKKSSNNNRKPFEDQQHSLEESGKTVKKSPPPSPVESSSQGRGRGAWSRWSSRSCQAQAPGPQEMEKQI